MKPNESMGKLLARITNIMVIIKDSYAVYQNKAATPQQDTNGAYLHATASKWRNNLENNAMQFLRCNYSGQPCLEIFTTIHHQSGAPPDNCGVLCSSN